MKTGYWILIGVLIITLIYGYNQGWFSNDKNAEVLDANGVSINPNLRGKTCDPNCLVPYPQGSQYYGLYYCNRACSSATFRTVYPSSVIVRPATPTPAPMPGPPKPTPQG